MSELSMIDPVIQRAREIFRYDPATGWLIRTVMTGSRGLVGSRVGSLQRDGYRHVMLDRKHYWEHRLIWAMETGTWPSEIDHINGVPGDNRWANLREVTHTQNHRNKKRPANNTSGVVGVYWHSSNSTWVARIELNEKRANLGSFATFDEAVAARKAAELEYGFHPNHGRIMAASSQ